MDRAGQLALLVDPANILNLRRHEFPETVRVLRSRKRDDFTEYEIQRDNGDTLWVFEKLVLFDAVQRRDRPANPEAGPLTPLARADAAKLLDTCNANRLASGHDILPLALLGHLAVAPHLLVADLLEQAAHDPDITGLSVAKSIGQYFRQRQLDIPCVMLHCPTCGAGILADSEDDPWFRATQSAAILTVACVCGASHCVQRSGDRDGVLAKHVRTYFITTMTPIFLPLSAPGTVSTDDAISAAGVVGDLCTTTSETMPLAIQDAFTRLNLTQGMPLVSKISSLVATARFTRLCEVITNDLDEEYDKYGHYLHKHLYCVACGEEIVMDGAVPEPGPGRAAGEGHHVCDLGRCFEVKADVYGTVMSYICLPMAHTSMTFTMIPKAGTVTLTSD